MKNIQVTKILILILLLFFNSSKIFASHATGAEFTYAFVGSNTYEITYTFYRDCHGILPDLNMEINITNECGYPDQTIFIPQFWTEIDLQTTCPSAITECHGGIYFGIEKWTYKDTITLSGPCVWTIGHSEPARNVSISTIVGNGSDNLFVYCTIDNTSGIINSSPVFLYEPILSYSTNQRLSIDNSVFDLEGDSISYELIVPRTGPLISDTVTFLTGYSYSQPFISALPVTIDPSSGIIEGFPQQTDISIYAVLVSEFRNGILIGQKERDMNLQIENSVNIIPDLSGINGTGSFEVDVIADQFNCFIIGSNDINGTNETYLQVTNTIPGMTIQHSGTLFDTVRVCWNPTVNDTIDNPYCFTISVKDDNCPYQGYQVRNYCFNVQLPTSINDLNSGNISIYPNPFNSEITIKLEKSEKSELNIFDIQGRKIVSKIIDASESVHDIRELENGLYVISIAALETNQVFYKRMMKVN